MRKPGNQLILTIRAGSLALAILAFLCGPAAGEAQPEGKLEFSRYCAGCHGTDGKGKGWLTQILVVPPPDLTQLNNRHDGAFPFWYIVEVIDGRNQIRTHGTREMPVWGSALSNPAVLTDVVKIIFYLHEIQED